MNMTLPASRILLAATLCVQAAGAGAESPTIERGAYLARIMDCAGCHMPRDANGAPLVEAGLSGATIGFEIPGVGIFWPPNLTPAESGLGHWSDAEIAEAIRYGRRPDGRVLAPVMPWMAYSEMHDEDLDALIAYLRSVPAVEAPRLDPVETAETARAPFFRVTLPAE